MSKPDPTTEAIARLLEQTGRTPEEAPALARKTTGFRPDGGLLGRPAGATKGQSYTSHRSATRRSRASFTSLLPPAQQRR
ncbi:hypothetical protein [Deinococcus sp. S9]|uniref:hypothetical protein n=1 Tax=Deinococcus sp. S9 TaxID=2545754 RepID=UPI0010545575|nr:hypothetical protein [Deinococcus sp. S9]TDE85041.1 hypothetical protein E0686_13845 [Deinococcus sp. S9]